MGYPMAVNLRSKMDPAHTLLICDVSDDALSKYQAQMQENGPVKVVSNGCEAVQAAVSGSVRVVAHIAALTDTPRTWS